MRILVENFLLETDEVIFASYAFDYQGLIIQFKGGIERTIRFTSHGVAKTVIHILAQKVI